MAKKANGKEEKIQIKNSKNSASNENTTVTIKKIGVLSFAKIQTMIMAAFGLVLGLIYIIVALVSPSELSLSSPLEGILLGLFVPIMYAALGFLIGLIGGVIYNLFAKWVGGIELTLEK